jgi:hypothetical protein
MENQDRNLIGSALRGGKPLKSYIKTILGKVYVTVWDSFENKPVGLLLEGDPRKGDEGCIIDIWTNDEDQYFKNKNRTHFTTGDVISYTRKTEERERTVEEYSDEELVTIINSKFFTLQNVLNNTDSVAVLFRIKNLAQDNEKSDKLIRAIEARISEVQADEFKPMPRSITVEL